MVGFGIRVIELLVGKAWLNTTYCDYFLDKLLAEDFKLMHSEMAGEKLLKMYL